jgi:uncharacterized protein
MRHASFSFDSGRRLKHDSNFLPIVGALGRGAERDPREVRFSDERAWKGEASMARFEISDQAALGATPSGADTFFEFGMMYSTGGDVPIDYVTAHKWFNLAAMHGNKDAVRLRREIAAEMTADEIAAAQRAARDWLRTGAAGTVTRTAA